LINWKAAFYRWQRFNN